MLVGYNTNISYKGEIYHIQTEDSGLKNPVVVTLLYSKGTIIASKKTSYAHIINDPDCREKARNLMREQHRCMIKDLMSGKYTGERMAVEISEEPIEQPKKDTERKDQIAGSLDDILLNYIIKRK
ncbi:MAG: hypothetical protein AB1610_07065 [Nitrospirota bacterium]